jgi:hypothetical protein
MRQSFDDLLNEILAQADAGKFLDEEAIEYEAARLSAHDVVVIYHPTGAGEEGGGNVTVLKGEEKLMPWLEETAQLPELAAFVVSNEAVTLALAAAMKRRARPALRLVSG